MNPSPHPRKMGMSAEPSRSILADAQSSAKSLHNMSQFVQTGLASPWPSLENIKKSARNEWTVASVKARIAELKIEHRQQLSKVIKYQVCEEKQLCLEQYRTFDELEDWRSADDLEIMKAFHRMERRLYMQQSDDFLWRVRYIHIMALKPLYEKLQILLLTEENARTQRARLFPKSSQGWRQMDTRDAKLKVANFLLLDKRQQAEMLSREFAWRDSKADVDQVMLEFKSNIMFSQEVRNFVKESQTTDPRRRPI